MITAGTILKYLKAHRTEGFFFACLLSVLLFYPSKTAGYLCAFLLPIVFAGYKKGIPAGVVIILLSMYLSSHVMVTEIKRADGEKWLYVSTWGSLVAKPGLRPGDMVTGKFHKQKYASEKEGRFARGYFIADSVEGVHQVPVAGKILRERQELSDRLYLLSGGRVFLTQALALGDRRYLPDYIRDMYTVTGLGHLLAVSGLHAGLYSAIVYFLFAFLPPKIRMFPVTFAMLLLIPFSGFKVTISRACMLVFFILSAKFLDYYTDVRKLLLFIAGCFMLITPSIAADISFILSFSAVYGLVHLSYSKNRLAGVHVGLVSSVFILPASAYVFGMFNVTSVLSTLVLVPVMSAQIIVFVFFCIFPSVSVAPLMYLERIHLDIVAFFAENTHLFYRLYKPDLPEIIFMVTVILYCAYKKRVLAACALLLVPYLPVQQMQSVAKESVHTETASIKKILSAHGAYFPNMVRSKGFMVIDSRVHVFYRGTYGDFKYKFLPYLAEKGVIKADTGSVNFYDGSENRLFRIDEINEDFGGVCVNEEKPECKAVYHTRSNTYDCTDEDRVHILYNNKKECRNMYLLKKTGDVDFDENSYQRR